MEIQHPIPFWFFLTIHAIFDLDRFFHLFGSVPSKDTVGNSRKSLCERIDDHDRTQRSVMRENYK